MKKNIIDYYALIIAILFIVYNLVLKDLKIGGLLYQIFMIVLTIFNIAILIRFRKRIKLKGLIIVIYFFTWMLLSKNALQCLFGISNMITLVIIGFKGSNFIKVISALILLFFLIFSTPLLFFYIFIFGSGINEEVGRNDIYSDTHYFCNNNYEVYSYSAGAMDGYHYSIGKHYEFLHIKNIIHNEVKKFHKKSMRII